MSGHVKRSKIHRHLNVAHQLAPREQAQVSNLVREHPHIFPVVHGHVSYLIDSTIMHTPGVKWYGD